MMDRKRRGALLLCFGFLMVLLVSSAFLIHEADHDCCGEDCPVCRTIAMTTSLMRAFCLMAAALLLSFVLPAQQENRRAPEDTNLRGSATPVSLKIRLND